MRKNQKVLMVKINDNFEYVFCRNKLKRLPITTKIREKALSGIALNYFTKRYASLVFKVVGLK